jgi:hypothetical protein
VAEGVFFQVPLIAVEPTVGEPVLYQVIAGQLPAGVQCAPNGTITGIPQAVVAIQGVPDPVSRDVTSKFAVRAYTEQVIGGIRVINRLADRTFTLTVTGQDAPEFVTPAGSLGTFYDCTVVEGIQVEISDTDPDDSVMVVVAAGSLPPGLTMTRRGLISGFTQSVVPDAMAFRLFQDMRGVQTTFRITTTTTTTVAQEVSATADTIYVTDAAALSEPNLSAGIFGVVTIDGERILYRVRDLARNLISSLQRGTAGTAATTHSVNADVYDMGLGNRQPQEDQNYILSDTSTGDGSTTIFYAPSIAYINLEDSSFEPDSIEVYVGGNRARNGYYAGQFVIGQTYTIASVGNTNWHAIGLPSDVYPLPGVVFTATGVGSGTGVAGDSLASNYYQETDYDPLAIQFLTANDLPAPGAGVDVVILQRKGVTWYAPGINEPSNGEPLQLTETNAARFLRGI